MLQFVICHYTTKLLLCLLFLLRMEYGTKRRKVPFSNDRTVINSRTIKCTCYLNVIVQYYVCAVDADTLWLLRTHCSFFWLFRFLTKICTCYSPVETSAIDLRLEHSVQNGLKSHSGIFVWIYDVSLQMLWQPVRVSQMLTHCSETGNYGQVATCLTEVC